MMYVCGDVRYPLVETTQVVESTVHSQITHVLVQAASIARRRGARSFSPEDLLFLIRKNSILCSRLVAYLGWRRVRKVANRVGNDDDEVADDGERVKKQKIRMKWVLTDQFLSDDSDSDDDVTLETERLRQADEITRQMTHEEYLDYAECRQASFTYKKPARFKEWLNVEGVTGMKPNADLLDVVGFLCFEMVRSLTTVSLEVKNEMEAAKRKDGIEKRMVYDKHIGSNEALGDIVSEAKEQYRSFTLFKCPNEKTPIEPSHVYEAYRRIECDQSSHKIALGSSRTMNLFQSGPTRKLI